MDKRLALEQDRSRLRQPAATRSNPRHSGKDDSMTRPSRFAASAPGKPVPSATGIAGRPARVEFIERSHQRSAALGLSRGEALGFDPMIRSDLAVARERNQRLYAHAAPVMQMLFEQIVNTESMIVLTDAQGTILHSVGDDDFLQRADKVALTPGENWAEHAKGTNAIGTALFEEAPTLVHANEHFMHANNFLTCSAAPIFDPRGNMLGVLDVTGDHRSYHQHTMGLVRMSARMIENHWLSDDFNNRLRLHFHSRAEFIGTLLEGIVVVGADGKILGANRGALDLLGMSVSALRFESVASLFGTTPSAIYDHFRSPLSAPMPLSVPGGHVFYATARFDWPSRPIVAGAAGRARREAAQQASASYAAHAAASTAAPLGEQPEAPPQFPGLQYLRTGDPQLDLLVSKIQRIVDRAIPLLILGETGTGKDVLARAVHQDSKRAQRPFVAVNCAAIPEALIEAELFGCEDGAFAGARRKGSPGRIVQASGGTLFLDGIGDMPPALQARLLRVLQERCVTPLGGSKGVAVDIAVIGATHRNLLEMIERHEFREDLYYRLNGLALRLPPLRERSDLEALARRLLQVERPLDTPELSPQVLEMFRRYTWPGNVRQLANVLRTAAVMAGGERMITATHLPDDFVEDARRVAATHRDVPAAQLPIADFDRMRLPAAAAPVAPLRAATRSADPPVDAAPAGTARASASPAAQHTLEQAEIEMIRATLEAAGGNISAASKQLGISRNTIYRKLRWNVRGEPPQA
jgi:sigma-54 dependent transcriptional regulator, acetoin dehydrogenase operon transcriptional activator AcoR